MAPIRIVKALDPPASPAATEASESRVVRIGAVQERWREDRAEHEAALAAGIVAAAGEGAALVCLQELTLSRYFAVDERGPAALGVEPEELPGGRTHSFAARMAAQTGAQIHASLYERADGGDGLGYNTAIVVAPDGRVVARTRKLHIPVTAGYYEDRYFRPGPSGGDTSDSAGQRGDAVPQADDDAYPVVQIAGVQLGLPTCWDQWFGELARIYSLSGAELLVYPTAIGSEPDHPGFDTEPLWEQVILGNAISNGLFMVAVNRVGEEPPLRFYGSSFICDPYGRKLVQAPREEPAVLVADLDLGQRADWLALFPFLQTRRPDAYAKLVEQPQR